MHMIDVIAKLKEIAENGYDNEDMQRGITAAATQNYEVSEEDNKLVSEISVLASEDDVSEGTEMGTIGDVAIKQFGAGDGRVGVQLTGPDGYVQLSMEETTELAGRLGRWAAGIDKPRQGEYDESVSSDAVEEVHEDVEEDTILADMLKLAGRSGVMGLSQNNIIAESLELDEQEIDEGQKKSKMIDDAESMSMEEFVEEYSAEGMSEAEAKQAYKEIMGEAIGEEAVSDDGVEEVHEVDGQSGVLGLVSESVEADEAVVSIPVQELTDIMKLAGYDNYAEKIEEYANEPDETYMDAEEQLVGLSGGLNSPKSMHPTAAGGDNAMAVRALDVEEIGETFYQKYNDMIDELKTEEL